jgi:hypothetical protein
MKSNKNETFYLNGGWIPYLKEQKKKANLW